MKIINTVEGLKEVVTEDCRVSLSPLEGSDRISIKGGWVNLKGYTVKGLDLHFDNCEIHGNTQDTNFRNCEILILDSRVKNVQFQNNVLRFRNSEVSHVGIDCGNLTLTNTEVSYSNIYPESLFSAQSVLADLHATNHNSISAHMVFDNATASCSEFGTYAGNVHYLGNIDTVIAGCWQGGLEDFKEKAQKQGVAKIKYEAVYNYFKSFK